MERFHTPTERARRIFARVTYFREKFSLSSWLQIYPPPESKAYSQYFGLGFLTLHWKKPSETIRVRQTLEVSVESSKVLKNSFNLRISSPPTIPAQNFRQKKSRAAKYLRDIRRPGCLGETL